MGNLSIVDMIRMREAGFTLREIAEKDGNTSRQVLGTFFRENGIHPPERIPPSAGRLEKKYGPNYAEKLRRLHWDEEMSFSEMEQVLGIPQGQIHDHMTRLGVERRSRSEAMRLAHMKRPNWKPTTYWTPETGRQGAAKAVAVRRKKAGGSLSNEMRKLRAKKNKKKR